MKKVWHKIRYSLSLRLILLFIITSIIVGSLEIFAVSQAFKDSFENNLKPHFRQYVAYLLEDIGTPPDLERARQLADILPLDIQITGLDEAWTSLGDGIQDFKHLHTHSHGQIMNAPLRAGFHRDRQRLLLFIEMENYHYTFYLPTRPDSEQHRIKGAIILIILLLTMFMTYRIIRRMLQPLAPIREGVSRIGRGELTHRIRIHRKDELGELGDSIDLMADDIEKLLESKRQLLLAISHELRSPISRGRVSVELLEQGKIRDRLDSDLREMTELVDLLIETEKLNQRHKVLNRKPTALDELIQQSLAPYPNGSIELVQPQTGQYVLLDALRVQLLIRNLLDNALRFNRDELGKVTLKLNLKTDALEISVIDHGTGIPSEHLDKVLEPFYRADASRTRKTGGFGLGLYLCRMIAEAHSGHIVIDSDVSGTTVNAWFPLNEDSQN